MDIAQHMIEHGILGIDGGTAGTIANGCSLIVERRTASFTIPTTQTIFIWDTEVSDPDDMYDHVTGVVTCKFTGQFNFAFMFNTETASGQHHIISAAEVSTDGGTTWTKSQYSARQQAVRTGDNTQATYVSTNRFVGGTKLRFPTWCDADVTIVTETPTAGTGFTIPAARLLITGIRTD